MKATICPLWPDRDDLDRVFSKAGGPKNVEYSLFFPAKPGPIPFDRINDGDRAVLHELGANVECAIEVGSFLGGSAEALLGGMPGWGRLTCVDTFRGTAAAETAKCPRWAMVRYLVERLEPFGDRVTVIIGESVRTASLIAPQSMDLIFLDAAHDYPNVQADLAAWLPKLKPGGLFAGHDFCKWIEMLSPDEYVAKSMGEMDGPSGLHWGVTRAVIERFRKIEVMGDVMSTIWTARPEWARSNGHAELFTISRAGSRDLEMKLS